MLLHWSKKWESIPTHKIEDKPPQPPFFLASAEVAETLPPADFLIPGWVNPAFQVRPVSQRGTTTFWHSPLFHIEVEPSPWPGFATYHGGKSEASPWRTIAESVLETMFMAIQASLNRKNYILETVKKWGLWSPDLAMLPGSRIKNTC